MQAKPQHFHLTAFILLVVVAIGVAAAGYILAGGVIGLGAFVALMYWKSVKSGVFD